MNFILQKILSGLSVLTIAFQSLASTTTPPVVNNIATSTFTNVVATTTISNTSPIKKVESPKSKTSNIASPIVVKKQETTQVPSTKTCMSGSIISIYDYCKKTCPDGEVILENLTCRTVPQPVQNIQQNYTPSYQDNQNQIQVQQQAIYQAKIDSNSQIYTQIKQLQQQALDIKTQYNTDKTATEHQAIPQQFITGQLDKLLNEANSKIENINLQIQQLQLQIQ